MRPPKKIMPLCYWKRSSPIDIVYAAYMVYYLFVQQRALPTLNQFIADLLIF